jgi:hypothetical protein
MADIKFDVSSPAPDSEFSPKFVQGMADRMATSYYKYGKVALAYPKKVDAISSLEKRLEKYKEDGNTEWLMDLANFAMIEFMHPKHEKAHFRPTDSKESPGRKWFGEVDPSKTRRNEEI